MPVNYLFPPSSSGELPSDLTSLDVLLAGPIGTPYAQGVWRLHLDIPHNYPTAPPTATFRTRLWHPNIDEATGAVCVETLKRDWTSTLKLRDVLVTISCLLIQPNPASALNEAAGKLASEDWDSFCRRAKLMTEIHAAIPSNIAKEVKEAQTRGDEDQMQQEVKAVESKINGKTKVVPSASKVQSLSAEDEENSRRRAETVEVESDPETDWIPGPFKSTQQPNMLGIQGLDNEMQVDSSDQSRITRSFQQNEEEENHDISDPFITVPSKHPQQSFSLSTPHGGDATAGKEPTKDTPERLRFSHLNPFSAIQPNNQTLPRLREFSWSWTESEIMHETGRIKNGETKAAVRKRLASKEFEKKRKWELKKFAKAGYDLSKYNRGDFGPRVGIGRL